MATQWFYLQNDCELGPIPYSELIKLVHGGIVLEEDLVRPDWQDEWQRADSVVGLFYMARRLRAQVEAVETGPSGEDQLEEGDSSVATNLRQSIFWTIWPLSRFLRHAKCSDLQAVTEDRTSQEVIATKIAGPNPRHEHAPSALTTDHTINPLQIQAGVPPPVISTETTESLGLGHDDCQFEGSASKEWSSTVSSALEAANARDSALARERDRSQSRYRLRGVLQRIVGHLVQIISRPVVFLFGWTIGVGGTSARDRVAAGLTKLENWLPRPGVSRILFKLGSAIAVGNLVAFGILRWSDREALRFPDAETSADRVFPVIGQCGPTEFAFLVFQAALISGVAAYGAAVVLEANADD